jgi:signal transduction histidine kinase
MAGDSTAPKLRVASEVSDLTFSRTVPDLDRLNLVNGSIRAMPDVLSGELASRLGMTDFSTAPIQASLAKGRLFILGNIRRSDDHLLITRIVADRVGAELDRQIFLERAAESAAMRERASIMRDLHDGLLQNLTAARAQLEMLPADGEYAKMQLERTRELLRTEQRRVREFVDQTHAADNENVALETLRPLAEETARFWGCVLSLSLQPQNAIIARKTANQLSLMLAEAVANAVRHGLASAIYVTVSCKDDLLEFTVRDDGQGFPDGRGMDQPLEISEAQLPRSLNARVVELGGHLYASTSVSGSLLRIELPL